MDIEEERQKRILLVKKMKRLYVEMDLVIRDNLGIISDILTLEDYPKITDWPKKVALLRACSWINQIRGQKEDLVREKLKIFSILEYHRAYITGPRVYVSEDYELVEEEFPWSKERKTLRAFKCVKSHDSLDLEYFVSEEYTDLVKTEFVYKHLAGKKEILPNDYFLEAYVDIKTGIIEFKDKLQTISPNILLDDFKKINSFFDKPITLRLGINSLKLYIFKSKVNLGLFIISRLLDIPSEVLEEISFSKKIESYLVRFIREEDILNDQFRNYLHEAVNQFIEFLFKSNACEYSKMLTLNFTLLSFTNCTCNFDLSIFSNSKYFYLVKWAHVQN